MSGTVAFTYRWIKPNYLQEGDEIQADDGSWHPPVQGHQKEPGSKLPGLNNRGLAYRLVWTSTEPGSGPADLRFHPHRKVRVRRTGLRR